MTNLAYEQRTPPLLVPCTGGAPHAFGRAADCTTCHGTWLRPADDVEYVYCDEANHEHELRGADGPTPELEGVAPEHDNGGTGAVWNCFYRGCGGNIILTRAGA